MRYFFTLILTICFDLSFAQPFAYPSIKTSGNQIADFVPTHWAILDSAQGDLNKDGIKDAAIVIQTLDSISMTNNFEDTVLTHPRILLVLLKNKADDTFTLIEQSNSFILKNDNPIMDNPYQGVSILKGILQLDFHLFYNTGSWYFTSSSYEFQLIENSLSLIRANLANIHRATLDYEEYSFNFLKKKKTYIKGNSQTNYKKTTRSTFQMTHLKTFKTLREPYSWEIETDILL